MMLQISKRLPALREDRHWMSPPAREVYLPQSVHGSESWLVLHGSLHHSLLLASAQPESTPGGPPCSEGGDPGLAAGCGLEAAAEAGAPREHYFDSCIISDSSAPCEAGDKPPFLGEDWQGEAAASSGLEEGLQRCVHSRRRCRDNMLFPVMRQHSPPLPTTCLAAGYDKANVCC